MERSVIFQNFVDKWTHPEYRPTPVAQEQLDKCARELEVEFPASYIEYATVYGSGGPTMELLNSIVDGELEVNDLSDMHTPDEIIDSIESWKSAGMPNDLVPIASDSMGNMFCFKHSEIMEPNDDAGIWFFDHDFDTVEKTHDSFTAWINELVQIENLDA